MSAENKKDQERIDWDVVLWPSRFNDAYKAMKKRYGHALGTMLALKEVNPQEAARLATFYIDQLNSTPKEHPALPANGNHDEQSGKI